MSTKVPENMHCKNTQKDLLAMLFTDYFTHAHLCVLKGNLEIHDPV